MLRCLYLCVEVGAAFVNCLPVITTSVTGKCLSSSLYLEWFANMILNHSEFSYKITVLSMRAATHKCMNKAMSAYLSLHSNMSLIKIVNLAAIACTIFTKNRSDFLILDAITYMELYIDRLVDMSMDTYLKTNFRCNMYPDSVLKSLMGMDSVRPLVEQFVGHVLDRHLDQTANSIKNMYIIMSDSDIGNLIEITIVYESDSIKVNEDVDAFVTNNTYNLKTAGRGGSLALEHLHGAVHKHRFDHERDLSREQQPVRGRKPASGLEEIRGSVRSHQQESAWAAAPPHSQRRVSAGDRDQQLQNSPQMRS